MVDDEDLGTVGDKGPSEWENWVANMQSRERLQTVINELQDLEVDAETINLNVDDLESKLDTVIANQFNIEDDIETTNTTLDTPRQEDGHGSSIDNLSKVRNYAEQPDGDIVGRKATGELFNETVDLAGGGTFTSDWYDTNGWASLELFVASTETSAPDGVRFEFTEDVQAADPSVDGFFNREFGDEAAEKGFAFFKSEANLDGFRIKYENNGDPVNNITFIGTAKSQLSLDGAEYVGQNTLANNFVRVGTDFNSQGLKLGEPSSLFGDLATIERTTVLDVSSTFGTSVIRDEIDTTGSAQVAQNPDTSTGELVLETGTTANSDITLATAEYGRYTPGYSAEAGVGIRIPDIPTEGEARWGYFNGDDGFYFGYDGDQGELFIGRRKDGTEAQRIYRSDFNRNSLDEVLGIDWDVDRGAIFQIDFSWYGYGIIQFTIVDQTANDLRNTSPRQDSVVVHALVVEGETSVSDPNQPVTVELENGDTGDNNQIRIGGRQFSVFGQQSTERRITAESEFDQTVQDGVWTHLMSWTRDQPLVDANSKLNINSMDFAIDQTAKVALVYNADVTGTTYVNPSLTPEEETLLGVSLDGTFNGIGNGTKVWEGSVRVGTGGPTQLSDLSPEVDVRFGQNGVLSLIAQCDGGTGQTDYTMRMEEDW